MRNRRVVSVASEIVRILESGLATEVQSARLTAFLVAENASSLIAAIIGIMRVGETLDSFIISNGLVRQFQEFVAEKAKIEYELDSISAGGPDTMIVKTHRRDLVFDLISSSGTQALKLFFYWMKHFNQVKFLFMDEFDAFYHYELAEAILKDVSADTRFQTVFTSHNTSLISNRILRPDCYFEMENGRMGPLSERTERELRMGNNLEKLYRGGEFDE